MFSVYFCFHLTLSFGNFSLNLYLTQAKKKFFNNTYLLPIFETDKNEVTKSIKQSQILPLTLIIMGDIKYL